MSANIFSLSNLRQWLETKPPEEIYCYATPTICLAAQYLHAHGALYSLTEGGPGVSTGNKSGTFHEKLEYISCFGLHTFGAALSRTITLEKELAS